jgi:peptidoglycan/xylan/chitin deacetylase (PgdA/CDA1 family)
VTVGQPSRRALLAALGAGLTLPVAACSEGAPSGPAGPTTATSGGSVPATSSSTSTTASGSTGAAASATGGTASARPGGPDITNGPRSRNAVALTFHGAGDVGILQRMLAEFADADAKITVLAIGQWLAEQPQVAKLVLDGGHDLGNHTWSHQTMPRLAPAAITTEVDRAAAQLRAQTGSAGRWFRPSGTPHSTPQIRAAAVAAGYGACLGYDVDPLDYTDPGPAAITRAFKAAVKPGSVVSLHLGHPGTLAAMPDLLAHLHDRGLSAVTASDLLGTT